MEFLSDKWRVIYPDIRGHGQSMKFCHSSNYTFKEKAKDISQLIQKLKQDTAVVGGVSMGGALALRVAIDFPEQVKAVVGVSAPPFATPTGEQTWWQKNRGLVESGNFSSFLDETLLLRAGKRDLEALKLKKNRYDHWVERLQSIGTPSLLALLDETYSREDWAEECGGIRCPTLLIAGVNDRFPTAEMSTRLASIIPKAEFHLIEGAGHFPMRSHRRHVVEKIRQFVHRL